MRATVLEVSKSTFLNNIDKIKEFVGNKEIMPVIKANAYGTYLNKDLEILNKFNIVAVALVEEAIELRELGYKKEIFVLNQPSISDIKDIIKHKLTIGLSSKEFLEEVMDKKIKVHLEIETGMNRTGIKLVDLEKFIKKVKKSKLIVEGIYTHLSSADFDKKYTLSQLNTFCIATEIVKDNFDIKYIHSLASNGIINYLDDLTNLVRPGIIMYGYESFKGSKNIIDVLPVCKLKTEITYIKDIDKNEKVSYSQKFTADRKMKVATISIGYADGLRRELFDKGEVVVNGKKAKIIGTICMDSCMIDITDIKNVKVGDTVYIWDNENITLDEIAEKCNTINYEILSTISSRVPRVTK